MKPKKERIDTKAVDDVAESTVCVERLPGSIGYMWKHRKKILFKRRHKGIHR